MSGEAARGSMGDTVKRARAENWVHYVGVAERWGSSEQKTGSPGALGIQQMITGCLCLKVILFK